MEGSKRVYQRTLANIRPWPKHLLKHPAGTQDDLLDEGGNLIDAKNNTAYYFGRLPIGSIAGIIESEGSKMIHFGRVIKHIGQENVFHMFGTTGKKGNRRMAQSQLAKHAQFLPTFTDTNDGKLILGKKNARRYRHKQWTWKVHVDARQTVMRDVKLTENGRLTVASAKAIPKNFKLKTL